MVLHFSFDDRCKRSSGYTGRCGKDRNEGLYIAAVAIAACTVAVAVPAFHAILAVIIGARVDVNSAGDERLVLCLC